MTESRHIGVPGAPVTLSFEPGPDGVLPREIDLELTLPVLRGSGRLVDRGGDEYAGVLLASVTPMSGTAMGVLRLPRGNEDLSLLVVIGATFPPPGIQLGFGFAVSGMGGVVGLNRRIDRDALLRAVAEGWAADLLFPVDPIGAADTIIANLPTLFTPSRGSVVAGPMFQLSWGGRLVSASVRC